MAFGHLEPTSTLQTPPPRVDCKPRQRREHNSENRNIDKRPPRHWRSFRTGSELGDSPQSPVHPAGHRQVVHSPVDLRCTFATQSVLTLNVYRSFMCHHSGPDRTYPFYLFSFSLHSGNGKKTSKAGCNTMRQLESIV